MPTSSPSPADPPKRHVSAVAVALFAWIIPGGGYLKIGMAWRGFAVLIAVLVLFVAGIFIGGIRVIDPPGYDDWGYMTQVRVTDQEGHEAFVQPNGVDPSVQAVQGPALYYAPITEISAKPWYVGQILCGPITLAASALANLEAHSLPRANQGDTLISNVPPSLSHSWELGTLYTAVAGMLNLMAIIDSVYRAAHQESGPEEPAREETA